MRKSNLLNILAIVNIQSVLNSGTLSSMRSFLNNLLYILEYLYLGNDFRKTIDRRISYRNAGIGTGTLIPG